MNKIIIKVSIDNRSLAAEIASEIMCMMGDEPIQVERIALMKTQTNGSEKNLGGLSRESLLNRINDVLGRHFGETK